MLERELEKREYIDKHLKHWGQNLYMKNLAFLTLKACVRPWKLRSADEDVERVASQFLEANKVFPYQTIGSVFSPLIVMESTSFDSREGSS